MPTTTQNFFENRQVAILALTFDIGILILNLEYQGFVKSVFSSSYSKVKGDPIFPSLFVWTDISTQYVKTAKQLNDL